MDSDFECYQHGTWQERDLAGGTSDMDNAISIG